jgi:response regulator RpfG family c-di-GMP phosphodiesterase
LLVAYGSEGISADINEPLLLIGLLALLTCAVAYFADKEREHRAENRELIQKLHGTARALDIRVARLNKLCETSTQLAGALDVDRISELVVEALVAQVEATAASLVVLDRSDNRCLHARSQGSVADTGTPNDTPESVARAAVAEDSPAMRLLPNAGDVEKRLAAWGQTRAAIYAPMNVSELVGGALAAMRNDDFSTEDLNLLTTLANMASKAIESAELHAQLRQSYFRTLHVLARSLAARDPYSASHGKAVTWLATRLAEQLGLDQKALDVLRAYGPLHDLGKIGISDSILLKQGPLTEEETQICRQHAVMGEEIIRPLSPGPAVLGMIRGHHERWDGTGYPDGRTGADTHILARVVTVADAFHAMTSYRPYRPATVLFPAVQEIKSLAGIQFDPDVVRALTALWENGEIARFSMHLGHSPDTDGPFHSAPSLAVPPPLSG